MVYYGEIGYKIVKLHPPTYDWRVSSKDKNIKFTYIKKYIYTNNSKSI